MPTALKTLNEDKTMLVQRNSQPILFEKHAKDKNQNNVR